MTIKLSDNSVHEVKFVIEAFEPRSMDQQIRLVLKMHTNKTVNELSKIFTSENLSSITVVYDNGDTVDFSGYTIIDSIRKQFDDNMIDENTTIDLLRS